MNDETEPEAIPPLSSGDIVKTLCDYGTTKLLYTYPSDSNVQLNNFPVGMRFRSKTEAIEQLCLKVFNATPIYGTDIEGLKTEEKLKKDLKVINEAYTDLDEMYSKIVAVSLECDPIPAKDRDDGKIEPPWEVFARIKRERDEARERADTMFAKHAEILDQYRRERDAERDLAEQRGRLYDTAIRQLKAFKALERDLDILDAQLAAEEALADRLAEGLRKMVLYSEALILRIQDRSDINFKTLNEGIDLFNEWKEARSE